MEYDQAPTYEDLISGFVQRFETDEEFRKLVMEFMFTPNQMDDYRYEGVIDEEVIIEKAEWLWEYDPEAFYWNAASCVVKWWEYERASRCDSMID